MSAYLIAVETVHDEAMTERPGAIAAIYDVPLPRPRSLDAMADPVFTELVQRIRKHFFTQSSLD